MSLTLNQMAMLPPEKRLLGDEPKVVEPWKLKSAWRAVSAPAPMREIIIDGYVRRGEVLNIIASTKIGKSWLALYLLFCVATGRDFLGRQTRKGRVLLLDNELHDETIQNRMRSVADAMGISEDEDRDMFEYLDLRGVAVGIWEIEQQLSRFEPGDLTLVVLDAKYRYFCNGLQENSNDDQTTFHNQIDQLAKRLDCVIALIHHSSKGDQGGKAVTDVGSGGGSQSRATDCHMIIRPHDEAPELAVLDAALRSFPKVEPISIRWKFPLWSVDNDIEAIVKQAPSRNDARMSTATKDKAIAILEILKREPDNTASENKLSDNHPSQKSFRTAIAELEGEDRIEWDPEYIPSRRKEPCGGWRLIHVAPDIGEVDFDC